MKASTFCSYRHMLLLENETFTPIILPKYARFFLIKKSGSVGLNDVNIALVYDD